MQSNMGLSRIYICGCQSEIGVLERLEHLQRSLSFFALGGALGNVRRGWGVYWI